MTRVAYYIDSHGFGHSTRSICLASHFPKDWNLVIKTNGPRWLFQEELLIDFEFQPSELDVHPIQSEGYRINIDATGEFLLEKLNRSEQLIENEMDWLRDQKIDLVLSDISPLAIESAHRCGIPCYGISNFTWHWIMEPFFTDGPQSQAIRSLEEMMGRATANFRLPFSVPEVYPGPSIETPLLTRLPRKPRERTRREFGMGTDLPYVLITFGGLDRPDRDLRVLEKFSPIQFVRTLSSSERRMRSADQFFERDREIENLWHYVHPELYHPDLVGVVDAVITKPGYGILSETMALGTPLLLDTRDDFREFDVVKEVLDKYPQVQFLPSDRMERLDFEKELNEILSVERKVWEGPANGAEFILERIQ
ncbi:MAG: hypothetical protein KC931_12605 [Candidatus Omnitrophica bacterium]|nr:hypothetical protein [Candidatus Omnitrophota bacterium]